MIGTTCQCGRIHGLGSIAVGRFAPAAPTRYRARSFPAAPVRATRVEALADECRMHLRPRKEMNK